MALLLLDLLLLALATARLMRLVITDDVGLWYAREPAMTWAMKAQPPLVPGFAPPPIDERQWRYRLVSGLWCPFCVGFWLGCLMLLGLALVGGPGEHGALPTIWRYAVGALALNYAVAHVVSRLDADDDAPEPETVAEEQQ